MLRNPLASPDVIGISSGASAAAVIGIVTLPLNDSQVSLMALGGALLTALGMYLLASRGRFAGGRLVLIGIGIAAMLQSVVAYVLARAAPWDLQSAMRWLTGSLNGATWERVAPLAIVCAVFVAALLAMSRDLAVLCLGDDSSAALGLRVHRTRLLLLVAAVVLLAFATAAAGPISFVAFMAGPIAARLVGPGASLVVPGGLVGALLVLTADLAAQNSFDHRYPVGVITGVLGAPYLITLLAINRSGGSL
jgi:iron complex transport system permease protein